MKPARSARGTSGDWTISNSPRYRSPAPSPYSSCSFRHWHWRQGYGESSRPTTLSVADGKQQLRWQAERGRGDSEAPVSPLCRDASLGAELSWHPVQQKSVQLAGLGEESGSNRHRGDPRVCAAIEEGHGGGGKRS